VILLVNRILVIRGGAIGDFILTLPTLKALREAYPDAHIEILGYAHIASLADNRFYANAVRSIEYGALSRFFARRAELPDDLAEYFAGFDLIISYLFDPDLIFQTNLERTGADNIVIGPAKLNESSHAALQLAEPIMADLGLVSPGTNAKIYPTDQDRAAAATVITDLASPIVALHPGSGSDKKNWPLANWMEFGNRLLASHVTGSIVVITGEADQLQASGLQSAWKNYPRVRFAQSLPLPHLAALLEKCIFVGHDSGISHLAAAAGAKCVLLFGPTNPEVWAPTGENVQVIRGTDQRLETISVDEVERAVSSLL
jgi:heptosyltransferase-2